MQNKITGITMGCPAGIGPEIIIKACMSGKINLSETLVFGDFNTIKLYAEKNRVKIKYNKLKNFTDKSDLKNNSINILDFQNVDINRLTPGKPDKTTGKASVDYIVNSVDLCRKKLIGAVVTCPINKETVNQAGCLFPGHTELLGHLTETDNFGMMLAGKFLRVLLVTKHISIADVPKSLSEKKIFDTIMLGHNSLKNCFGIKKPKLAVLSLNPHCGENGMFGDEEKKIIEPAVKAAIKSGINAAGPFSPDTLFPKVKNNFDCVICMYHDQGLIPLKLLAFGSGVNITVGLPIIRTSVDHGTAYDIAGKFKADPGSLIEAVKTAKKIIRTKK